MFLPHIRDSDLYRCIRSLTNPHTENVMSKICQNVAKKNPKHHKTHIWKGRQLEQWALWKYGTSKRTWFEKMSIGMGDNWMSKEQIAWRGVKTNGYTGNNNSTRNQWLKTFNKVIGNEWKAAIEQTKPFCICSRKQLFWKSFATCCRKLGETKIDQMLCYAVGGGVTQLPT